MICPSKNSWPSGKQQTASGRISYEPCFCHIEPGHCISSEVSWNWLRSWTWRWLVPMVGLRLPPQDIACASDACHVLWVAAFWLNAGETVFVPDISCEPWTCSIYFFGCRGFWSHPSLTTERGQLCSFLAWSPFVGNKTRIFEFFPVINGWEAAMKAFFLIYRKGIGFPSIPVAIHSEYLWFAFPRVPAPLLGGINSHRAWLKLQTGCWHSSVLTDWLTRRPRGGALWLQAMCVPSQASKPKVWKCLLHASGAGGPMGIWKVHFFFFFCRRDRARESCANNPPVNSWSAWLLLLSWVILNQPIGATWGLLPPMCLWASELYTRMTPASASPPPCVGLSSHPLGHFIYFMFIWYLLHAKPQRSSSFHLVKAVEEEPF